MKSSITKILLVQVDEDDYAVIRHLLSQIKGGMYKLEWESDYDKAFEKICRFEHDVYLIDYKLNKNNGLELIKESIRAECSAPIILLSEQGDPDVDFEAMHHGAADYLIKGAIDAQTLERSIRYAVQHYKTLKELHENELKYRTLFEKSIDAIFITTADHLFIEANPSIIALFGYAKEELLKLTVKDLFLDKSDFADFNKKILLEGQTKDFEAVLKQKDGGQVACLVNVIALYNTNDVIYGYQGIVHDITERKQAEKDLLIAEKLSMSGKIARSIAHEVRNPLTNLHLALEQLREELPNEDADFLVNIIKRNADRIGQLITDMLNSSKPKELNLSKQSVNVILQKACDLVADRIKLQEMRLEQEFCKEVNAIMLDEELLKTAFLNIIINAIEAMEAQKGVLKIHTNIEFDKVVVWIQDNGPGMSKETQDKLFDPFYTEKKDGMGLGLTSAQNIIQSHDGTIEVDSKPGKGTMFKIAFKRKSA